MRPGPMKLKLKEDSTGLPKLVMLLLHSLAAYSFQRNQVADKIREFPRVQLVPVGGHWRFVDEGVLFEARLLERMQAFLRIDKLQGESVLVQKSSGDRDAIPSYETDQTILEEDFGVRFEKRPFQLNHPPNRPNLRELWPEPRAFVLDAVAIEALNFALENSFALDRIAWGRGAVGGGCHKTEISND